MKRGVVISGLGILSSAGKDLAAARDKFLSGTCCLTPITDPRAARLRAGFAGQIDGFERGPELAGHDRHVHLALVAAREALADARVEPALFGLRMGLIFSTCSGPMLLLEAHYERILRNQPQVTAEELLCKRYYSAAPALAGALGVGGFCTTIVTACSASTAAIALAADLIGSGVLDAALAGGADSFSISTLAGFDGLKATTDGKCAPFSKPAGLNLGEAAGFVFLEAAECARERGSRPRGLVLGSGMSNDAHHCSAPDPGGRGLALAVRRTLAHAGLSPEQISYVNAHGTGTEANDKAECRALRRVFGDRAERLPVSSTKSVVGHCLGAAGAVEAIASIVCAESGVFPPTANHSEPRDGCAVDSVPEAGRAWAGPKVFLSNNSAFGGHNASLALALDSEGCVLPTADRPASRERVFITAFGVVSAAGIGLDALEDACREGRSGLSPVDLPQLPPLSAGWVDEAAVEAADRRLNLRAMDRSSKWATLAARLAIREAGFSEKPPVLAQLGLFLNLAAGPSWAESEFLTTFLRNDHQVGQLTVFPYIVPGSVAGNVCRALMLSGHNLTLNPGPAAGLLGLEPAVAALRSGHANALLCGAVDELSERILTDHVLAGWVSAENPPGEGAAVLMLESAPHADARGATVLGEICGLASAVTVDVDLAGTVDKVVAAALAHAGIDREAVRGVCASAGSGGLLPALLPQAVRHRRLIQSSNVTGWLEGTQPLLDLARAVRSPEVEAGEFILVLAAIPRCLAAAVVVQKHHVCSPR